MKICKNCNSEVDESSKFCGVCGSSEFIWQDNIKEKTSKNKFLLIIILILIIVVGMIVGSIFVYNSYFKDDRNKPPITTIEATSENEQPTEAFVSERIDYYSNIDKVLGKYGMAELTEFSYSENGQYIENDDTVYGLLSAFEYDCDSDSENELITLNLLPAESGGACLTIEMFSNVGIISKIDETKVSENDTANSAPILRNANEYSRIFAFIVSNKLCIIQDSYDDEGIDENYMSKDGWFSDFYVYELSPTAVSLYRHYYCHFDGWDCSIGETETNVLYTYNPTDPLSDIESEWISIKHTAYSDMINDVKSLGLESYFCEESELTNFNYITSQKIYEDNFFENDEAILIATVDTTSFRGDDQWTGVVKYMPSDYTNIRDKVKAN